MCQSRRPTVATLETGHVGLNVSDVGRSIDFYRAVFGFECPLQSTAPDEEWAFLTRGDDIVLTLWKQSSGVFPTNRPGLHHLSFQVDSVETVREYEERARDAGATIFHGGVVPHGEGLDSGGVYFTDPDGIRLEVYAPSGAAGLPAPHPDGPTCGFF